MRSPLLILLATSALAFTAACGASEEEAPGIAASLTAAPPTQFTISVSPSPISTAIPSEPTPAWTLPPDWVKYRWGNVTFYVPPAYEVAVSREADLRPGATGLVVRFRRGEADLMIDADDGTVIDKSDRTDPYIEQVLLTFKVGEPIDRSVWPLGADKPTKPKTELNGLRYWEPDPASGIRVGGVVVDPGGSMLYLDNGRSRLWIEFETGKRLQDAVVPDDTEAFYRWADSVEVLVP
jgi:hypothetical protein